MGGNDEIRDEVLARTAVASVTEKSLPREIGSIGGDRIVENLDRFELPHRVLGRAIPGAAFRKNHRANEQWSF